MTCDKVGFIWCENCDHRRQLINLGFDANFPRIDRQDGEIGPAPWVWGVMLGPGLVCWVQQILGQSTSDEHIWLLIAKMEMLQAESEKSA